MLILPASTYNTSEFMTAAGQLDVDIVVATDRGQVMESQLPAGILQLDFDALDRAVQQVREYAQKWPLGTIIGVDDHAALLAALASEALAISHNSPDAVRAAGNKLLMRQKLAASGLPQPAFEVVDLNADVGKIADRVSYPCVLKPLFLAASRGVIRADGAAQFSTAFERIRSLLTQPKIGRRGADAAQFILIEDYVPGVEVALEGLLTGGRLRMLALFDKPDPLEGPYFAETIYVTPSRLDDDVQSRVAAHVEEAAAALGLREGPVHAELRLGDENVFVHGSNVHGSNAATDDVFVIELAARSIGDLCSRVLEFGAGISLEELILRHALGLPVDELERTGVAGGVMMLPVPARGRLRGVDGIAAANMVPGIKEVLITIPVGKQVFPLPEGDRYLGFMFAEGDTPARVEASLREAHAKLHIVIEAEEDGK